MEQTDEEIVTEAVVDFRRAEYVELVEEAMRTLPAEMLTKQVREVIYKAISNQSSRKRITGLRINNIHDSIMIEFVEETITPG